jgi:hypothetical protein
MEDATQPCAWVIKRRLNADALKAYVSRHSIQRSQVVAITEPQEGAFTLIFEPNDEQQVQLAAEESEGAETLDELFGAPVTPIQTPVQTPSGAEVEPIITIPAVPVGLPLTAPISEPTPS